MCFSFKDHNTPKGLFSDVVCQSRYREKPCVTTKLTLNSTIVTGYIEELKITLQLSSQHDKKYLKVTICLVQPLLVKYLFNKTPIT